MSSEASGPPRLEGEENVPSRGARQRRSVSLAPGAAGIIAAAAALLVLAGGCGEGGGAPARAGSLPALRVEGKRIADEQGRTVLLRGVAVIGLGDYFQANPAVPSSAGVTSRDFDQIRSLGMNVVRLIVHWSALEPERGVWSEEYLARVREAVGWARERGIYVVLDMHQDAWGKFVESDPAGECPPPLTPNQGWDGAPEWATFTGGKSRCRFLTRELSPAVMNAWESFYEDREGIQGEIVETWRRLALAFRDDPTVAGYDLLNEPNWGLDYSFTIQVRKPRFHRRALEAIRAVERANLEKIVFFEPAAIWSAFPVEEPHPFTDDPGIVYAPHIYVESIAADLALFGRALIPLRFGFEQARREADAYGTTFWSGEWGWFGSPDGEYASRYAALEDEFQVGGAWWSWRGACGDPHAVSWPSGETGDWNGNLLLSRCKDPASPAGVEVGRVEGHARVLSRPYPRRFSGEVSFRWDPATDRFELEGQGGGGRGSGAAPDEIWVPGEAEPVVELEGADLARAERVEGGWLLEILPGAGPRTLRIDPAR